MREPVITPSAFNLLQLPQDVQLSILLAFNIRELMICKQMCRPLASLIDDDISLRYKVELARSGRIDGPPSTSIAVADRLASLREHRARFRANDHPLERMRGEPFGPLYRLSRNGIVTTVAGGGVHLWRPASVFSGIGEWYIVRTMRELQLEGFNTSSCVADVAQDLLVFSRRDINTLPFECFVYSLSTGQPHPSAYQQRFVSTLGSDGWPDYPTWDSTQVLGDLIAWNVPCSSARRCEMRVINWKTGVTVWEFHSELWWRCRLISESRVVVVTFESLLVYSIDCHCKSLPAPSINETALCILQLPAFSSISSSRSLHISSYIQFPPTLGVNDRPLYRQDPDLTLLTLEIHYIVDIPEDEPEFIQYAAFIPVSTIKTSVEVTIRTRSPPPPNGSPHIVEWNDWGPAGTRIVRFGSRSWGPGHFFPMGSSCAVTQRGQDPSGNPLLAVRVFDVHPWARPDPQHAGEAGRRFGHPTEREPLAGRGFNESIGTTFPFDVTRRDIPLTAGDRYPMVVLTEDGLLLVTSPV